MITGINELKTLTKDILCKPKCTFDGRNVIKIISRITKNVDMSLNTINYLKKKIFWILLHVVTNMRNIKQMLSITWLLDSVITCDKIIDAEAKSYKEETKTIKTNFNEKKNNL